VSAAVADLPFDTVQLRAWLERLQAGDGAARDELLRAAGARLERLARSMLRRFPNVRPVQDTLDVLQGASLRLLRTLERTCPASTRDFLNLAANHIRCELLDLARRAAVRPAVPLGDGDARLADPGSAAGAVADLERWGVLHEEAARLPAEEGEVFGLIFYQGWTHAQVAAVLGIGERTARRRWQAAGLRLAERLGGRLPDE
jgi:RNA polymerase sigma factor (sigma-70 family)